MALKTLDWKVDVEGRDKGKTFHIEEMSCWKAADWAFRALAAAERGGIQLPSDWTNQPLMAIAGLGFKHMIQAPFSEVRTLLNELMGCVSVKPSPGVTRPMLESDVEEISTVLSLYMEVFKLHVGFSTAAAPSTTESQSGTTAQTTIQSPTRTSPTPSP